VHLAGLAVLPWLPLAWYLQLALALVIVLGFVGAWRTHVLRGSPRAIRAAELDPEGAWTLRLADGRALAARLLPSSFVHPKLVVLNFRTGRLARRHLVLAADAADADALRRLRVRLRMGVVTRLETQG
jgi:toxin CptA